MNNRDKEAWKILSKKAREAWVRLESQKYLADHVYGSEAAVPKNHFDPLVEEVADLRYLVSHLVLVLQKNGISPFKGAKK